MFSINGSTGFNLSICDKIMLMLHGEFQICQVSEKQCYVYNSVPNVLVSKFVTDIFVLHNEVNIQHDLLPPSAGKGDNCNTVLLKRRYEVVKKWDIAQH